MCVDGGYGNLSWCSIILNYITVVSNLGGFLMWLGEDRKMFGNLVMEIQIAFFSSRVLNYY